MGFKNRKKHTHYSFINLHGLQIPFIHSVLHPLCEINIITSSLLANLIFQTSLFEDLVYASLQHSHHPYGECEPHFEEKGIEVFRNGVTYSLPPVKPGVESRVEAGSPVTTPVPGPWPEAATSHLLPDSDPAAWPLLHIAALKVWDGLSPYLLYVEVGDLSL